MEFIQAPSGIPDLPEETFNVVIYTLSLHHVPVAEMVDSLYKAVNLLDTDGVVVVIEPGDGGSFTEVKDRFGAGSGDERPAKEAAINAMASLDGWIAEETLELQTRFQFENDQDFFVNLLPGYERYPQSFIEEVRQFLELHRTHDNTFFSKQSLAISAY